MDRIRKLLAKLSKKERDALIRIIELVMARKTTGLDIKKLVNRDDTYRVRKGDFRIFFRIVDEAVIVIAIERRSDTTYS